MLDINAARDLARSLVERLEACRLTAYQDSVGKWTCGWGSTGPDIHAGTVWTQEIADHRLDMDMAQAEERLTTVTFGHYEDLANHQFAALWSFVFNVGAEPNWTIWADVKSGNLADVPAQLRRFVNGKVDGKETVIPGLEHRREAEIIYWNTADLTAAFAVTQTANAVPAPSSGLTRDIVTPPTPVPPPPGNTVSVIAKLATAGAGAAAAAGTYGQQVHDIVAPHATEAPIFNTLAIVASGIVVAAAIIGLMLHAEQAHARTV